MKRHLEVSAFILGGGASSRMGADKGLLEIGNAPLILRTAQLIEPLVQEVTIVGHPERYSQLGLRAISDRTVEAGTESDAVRTPLLGIATALSVTSSPWNLILACDLPYLTRGWVEWLLARPARSGAQIVMPRSSRGLEPLAALYRRECAAPILAALERGIRKVTDALSRLQIEYVAEIEWAELDPEHCVLKNMNSPEDYLEAKRRLETGNRNA
jgi:molybdopterin-guanine dinucleotide biosynthesis protein A